MNVMSALFRCLQRILRVDGSAVELVRDGAEKASTTIETVIRVRQKRQELEKVFPISGFIFPTEGE